jgi:hypothetical protein
MLPKEKGVDPEDVPEPSTSPAALYIPSQSDALFGGLHSSKTFEGWICSHTTSGLSNVVVTLNGYLQKSHQRNYSLELASTQEALDRLSHEKTLGNESHRRA